MYNTKTFTTTVVICAAIFLPRPASANPALLIPVAQELVNLGATAIGIYSVTHQPTHKHHSTKQTSIPLGTVEDAGSVSSQEECNRIAASRKDGKWRAKWVQGQTPVNDPQTGKRNQPVFDCKIEKYRN